MTKTRKLSPRPVQAHSVPATAPSYTLPRSQLAALRLGLLLMAQGMPAEDAARLAAKVKAQLEITFGEVCSQTYPGQKALVAGD